MGDEIETKNDRRKKKGRRKKERRKKKGEYTENEYTEEEKEECMVDRWSREGKKQRRDDKKEK